MQRIRLALVLGVLFQATTVAPADALSWWFLDALSGPKFSGPVYEIRLVCFKEPKEGEEGGKKIVLGAPGVILSFCKLEPTERRRASLDVNLGLLHADPNPQFANGQRIDLTMLSASFSTHIAGPFEVGFGIGNSWFSSGGIESFKKLIIEPVRLDYRPLRIDTDAWRAGTDPWYREVIVLRAGFVMFPAGFSSTELKGERLRREFVFYKGIFIDGEPIIRRILRTW